MNSGHVGTYFRGPMYLERGHGAHHLGPVVFYSVGKSTAGGQPEMGLSSMQSRAGSPGFSALRTESTGKDKRESQAQPREVEVEVAQVCGQAS